MKRILIVDDEFGLAEALRDLLKLSGYQVTTAWNGRIALEQLADSERPDLILLDVMMPIMNGLEVLRAIRANPAWRSIPVILMSAAAVLRDDELAQCAGFLRKPFDFDELLAMMRPLVGEPGGGAP
ncbi:MAG TPA: response regulator [Polyangia bacterium]|nr:response regulator [Polyangia bacterium]